MSVSVKQKNPLKVYDIVAKKPVARFYYKGGHTHPVRRTLVIISETETTLVGYEFREGAVTRSLKEATGHVKSYQKDQIAKWGDYVRLRMSMRTFMKDPNKSTLERFSIRTMFREGA